MAIEYIEFICVNVEISFINFDEREERKKGQKEKENKQTNKIGNLTLSFCAFVYRHRLHTPSSNTIFKEILLTLE